MKQKELLRKIMANVSKALSNDKYLDSLIEGGLIAEENGRLYLGQNALGFAINMYDSMADELIKHKKIPKAFKDRVAGNMAHSAPFAFDKIYNEFKCFLDHTKAAWDGPMIMVLTLAEPVRDPNLPLLSVCSLFEDFYELDPKKTNKKVFH